jgi:hypothetical protein
LRPTTIVLRARSLRVVVQREPAVEHDASEFLLLTSRVPERLRAEVAPLAGAGGATDPREEVVDEGEHAFESQALSIDGRQIGKSGVSAIDLADPLESFDASRVLADGGLEEVPPAVRLIRSAG